MTAPEKKPRRLRPWLEGLLNRGDVAGLQWLDDNRTMFRIVWKHHGKQDWSPEHGRVFMVSVGPIFNYYYPHVRLVCLLYTGIYWRM